MNTRILIPLLCAGAVALACGTRTRSETSLVEREKPAHRAHVKRDSSAPPLASAFSVRTEKRALHFALDLTNASKRNVELAFPSGQQYEFAVLDSVGREVYRWGTGRMFTQSLQNRRLDSGETLRIDESTDAKLPHGKYYAVATLRSSNYPLQDRVEFQLR